MSKKEVMCIGCDDEDGNMFMSCMMCGLTDHPGECTEYRHKYDMRIVQKVIPWNELQLM